MSAGKLIPLLTIFLISLLSLRFLPFSLSWTQAFIISFGFIALHLLVDHFRRGLPEKNSPKADNLPTFKGEMRLAASLHEAIVIVDSGGQIEHLNPPAKALFPDVKAGAAISSLAGTSNLSDLTKAALSGQRPEPYVYQVFDPVERHIRVTVSALQTGEEESFASRAIIVFNDVTDLERAHAMRADFLANASHELKTPVASLLGYIETLNGHAKDDPEARTQFLGIMQKQAERMQRLISDILSLRRIELSEHKAPTETADLHLAFLAAKQSIAPMAKQKNIKIKTKVPKELLVKGQQDELVQLFLNIIDNAVKMSEPDSKIRVTAGIAKNWSAENAFPNEPIAKNSARRHVVDPPVSGIAYAQLRIRDTGPGFKTEHLPRLSERFYRITGDRSSKEKGTGLGLAIVKHIVMRHRGGLLIETAENIGTEFTIVIPVSTDITAQETSAL